ncbi:hypothetical protein [Persicitalea sp.]|uniref:hypothetical protein n=1 Tax=Persicitalea sp. TaxID=3100273 RepID=UPI00359407C3
MTITCGLIYALSKLDGKLQKGDVKAIREILDKEPYGDLTVCGLFLRDYRRSGG